MCKKTHWFHHVLPIRIARKDCDLPIVRQGRGATGGRLLREPRGCGGGLAELPRGAEALLNCRAAPDVPEWRGTDGRSGVFYNEFMGK